MQGAKREHVIATLRGNLPPMQDDGTMCANCGRPFSQHDRDSGECPIETIMALTERVLARYENSHEAMVRGSYDTAKLRYLMTLYKGDA